MKTKNHQLLVNAAGQLMQEHAFDHLSDEKLAKMNRCIRDLNHHGLGIKQSKAEIELLQLCTEANLYTETASAYSIHQLLSVLHQFGKRTMPDLGLMESED
jgi:hypothetical protein